MNDQIKEMESEPRPSHLLCTCTEPWRRGRCLQTVEPTPRYCNSDLMQQTPRYGNSDLMQQTPRYGNSDLDYLAIKFSHVHDNISKQFQLL